MRKKLVNYWLYSVIFMVLLMVLIGGLTRLTNSGLSIVEWKPITGLLPPLNEASWIEEFSKYKNSPEFIHLNNHIDLEGFKSIFWLEYIHRIFARLTALVFFIPAIFFFTTSRLEDSTKKTISLVSILGICQGFMGWYMVKSGLVDAPYVDHFKLTFHLLFALTIYLTLANEAIKLSFRGLYANLTLKWQVLIILFYLQISLGGLTAGLNAGMIYNSFPLMGEGFIPAEILSISPGKFLHDQAAVQLLHRSLAYIIALYSFFISVQLFKEKLYSQSFVLITGVLSQLSLGVITLITKVAIFPASLHQIFAFILLGATLLIARTIRTPNGNKDLEV